MRGSLLGLLPLSLLASIVDAASYNVTVGKGGQLQFQPPTLNAMPGDIITYYFFSKNHSVVQSSFQDPCHFLPGGFFSGFTPTASNETASPTTWSITVNDTHPIWVYCAQTTGNHCQNGMVHAINAPTSGNTFDAFKSLAAKASTSTSPANGLPAGGTRTLHIDVAPGGTLTYSPNNVTELPGTVVEFSFNPANHSVVQSSFDDPCHPLANGFSSGFVPTTVSPSGVLFDIVIPDTKPIWFYCAQTTKTHCQAGMVGSINAPTTGNTLEAFIEKAKTASTSTIPPEAPLGGILSVNGTVISSDNGDVLNATMLDMNAIKYIPPPGANMSSYLSGMAGGAQPSNYQWAPSISDNATAFLQLLQYVDNILLEILVGGYANLQPGGSWAGAYPPSIVQTIGSMGAQALVHRATATDSLQHYAKPMVDLCSYSIPTASVDAFLDAALTVLLLEIALLLEASTLLAASDAWLVPVLGTTMGAKARMTGVVNMMQAHMAAAAPREAMLPGPLVYSYAANHYVSSCPDSTTKPLQGAYGSPLPPLNVSGSQTMGSVGRVTSVSVQVPPDVQSKYGANLWLAWVGPWGHMDYTQVANGAAPVPSTLYGHSWAVLVNKAGGSLQELPGVAVAGPAMIWISDV